MKNFYRLFFIAFILGSPLIGYSQTTIKGTVKDEAGESLIGVSILVKGTVSGTITDFNGNFELNTKLTPPLSLIFSMVGYGTQEVEITDANASNLKIEMAEEVMLGQEVVITGSRVAENIMESPVSVEKMDILDIQNAPADNYYKAIGNLKGVDMTSSSINFQIINTRGFSNTGNTRFVQLIDGMDTQAPALNFPIGNLNGPSELDVESVELIPGAASALYGPNAFNGVLSITSKNAFEYQGLSAFVKQGVNHLGPNANQSPAPLYEASLRYAKAFNDKFAFKVNFSYMKAEDWHGVNYGDREIARTPAGFGSYNPGSDLMHAMGDEASINLAIFPFSSAWRTLASSTAFGPGLTADSYRGDLPSHVVSITGIPEELLIDYGAENKKLNAGLYYRINDKYELSYLYNAGFGTSIYTGAQRYSLSNFGIQQHRVQLRSDNLTFKAYTTIENSGDSYITEFLAKRMYDKVAGGVSSWLGTYGIYYTAYLNGAGLQPGDIQGHPNQSTIETAAHQFARAQTEGRYPLYSSTSGPVSNFESIKESSMRGEVPNGPRFNDHTRMYQADLQYDFKDKVEFMDLTLGASYRMFDLRSNGTIFPDSTGNPISISEYGAYMQASKKVMNDKVKLGGSLRYDKNQNFDGQINPRLSAVIKVKENNNLRMSFQTGFRNPTTQGQHINLDIISSRLLGGLPIYADQYNLTGKSVSGLPLGYEGYSVQAFTTKIFDTGIPDPTLLEAVSVFNPVKPEKIKSFEIGYKGLLFNNNLMVDVNYYYNIYTDFITQIRVRVANEFTTDLAQSAKPGFDYNPNATDGDINYLSLLNGTSSNTFQIYTNIDDDVTSQGFGLGLDYQLLKGYKLGASYNWTVINDIPEGFLAEFNTPEHKINFNFGNRKLTDKMGFNVTYKWQSEFAWESSFTIPANGNVPAISLVDAQVTYKLDALKSILKIGGSNVLNKFYSPSLGGPNIGAIYYLSLTFDDLLN